MPKIPILSKIIKTDRLPDIRGSIEVTLQIDSKILDELSAKETVAWDYLSKYKFIMFGYHAAIWVTLNRIHRCRQRNPFLDVVKLAKLKIEKIRCPEGRGVKSQRSEGER